jgi:hypothetical protein
MQGIYPSDTRLESPGFSCLISWPKFVKYRDAVMSDVSAIPARLQDLGTSLLLCLRSSEP